MRDHEDHATAIARAACWIAVGLMTAAFLATWMHGCAPVDPPPIGPDAGPVDAGPCSDGVHDACDLAAQHLCDLGCGFTGGSGIDRIPGNADDDTFAEACRAISFNTTCLASATTCEEAARCQ